MAFVNRASSDPFLDNAETKSNSRPIKALPPSLAHLMNGNAPKGKKLSRAQELFTNKRMSAVTPPSPAPFVGLSLQDYRFDSNAPLAAPTTPSTGSWAVSPTSTMSSSGGLPTPGGSTIYQSNDIARRQPALPASPLSRTAFNRPPRLVLQTPLSNTVLATNTSSPIGSEGFPFPTTHTPPLTPSHALSSPTSESPNEVRTPGDEQDTAAHIRSDSPENYYDHDRQETEVDADLSDDFANVTISAKYLSSYSLHPHFNSQYVLSDELGSGGFGFVVKATRLADGISVAVKFIFKDRVPSHGWISKRFPDGRGGHIQEWIPTEVYCLQRIRHPGVVAFIDLYEDATFFYLVMEYHGSTWSSSAKEGPVINTSPMTLPALQKAASSTLPPSPISPVHLSSQPMTRTLSAPVPPPFVRRSSCDLFECIEQYSKLSEDQARFVFAQIVSVVYHLHVNGICHRDIKDENIVIDDKLRVKLIDFGSAVLFNPRGPLPAYDKFYGTIIFASPEILLGYAYQAPPAEVWSLGILFSVLLCGESIFRDSYHVIEGKIHQNMYERLSRPCQQILAMCLHPDPLRRATVADIRKHPWLKPTIVEIERERR